MTRGGAIGVLAAVLVFGPARAGDLAVLADQSARIVDAGSKTACRTTMPLRVEAVEAGFFDTRHADLGSLFGAALNQLLARCPGVAEIAVTGRVGNVDLTAARARADDAWALRLELPKLEVTAAAIPEKIRLYSDLPRLEEMFRPYAKVNGIAATQGYRLFAQNAKAVVDRLTADPAAFDRFAGALVADPDKAGAKQRLDAVLSTLGHFDPVRVPLLRERHAQIERAVALSALEDVLTVTLVPATSLSQAVRRIGTLVEKEPLAPVSVASADARLAAFVEAAIVAHEAAHPGAYLDAVQAHLGLLEDLGTLAVSDRLPLTARAVETAAFWFETRSEQTLAETLGAAEAMIGATGDSYADVDLVLETGIALSEEFAAFGFGDEADRLLAAALGRIETLIEAGLPEYRARLAATEMTPEAAAAFREEAAVFDALAQDFPQFAAYAPAITEDLRAGTQRFCRAEAARLAPGLQDSVIRVADAALSLTTLSCELMRNDHRLTAFETAARGTRARLVIATAETGEEVFDLVAEGAPPQFTGTADGWEEAILSLIVAAPTGVPDARGVTECDLLAGDPQDAAQPTEGVDLASADAAHDFDRTLDACIAAVEHDPDATRQVYQLARTLDVLGEAEAAAQYVDVAVARDYAPALHLKAFGILTAREDDDAFFDAVDLFEQAAAAGYAPARAELAQLMPPGADLFRETPPPGDTEVLDAMGRKICEGNGFVNACSIRTGVHRKDCFQTSETEFSCEIVLKHRCQVNSGSRDPIFGFLGGLIENACPPTTDPMFMKFTRTAGGWRARKEF